VATISPGLAPIDMFFDGESLWAANAQADTVTKISLDGEVIGVYDVGDVPIAFTSDGENIWVANWRENTISKLAPDGTDLGKFPVGMLAYDFLRDRLGELPFALTFDGEYIWTANSGHGTVSRKNLDGVTIATYPVGSGPASLVFDGTSLWVTNTGDDTVSKLTLP
ncbi:MAG: hypothetical protein IIC24_02180, partial [Chloroflexi bacterium]|nr:hypothetical protein [Chloroflexota bacterium]